jgi:hypothetical protein
MAKKKIFISYDYDHDRHYKNLLLAWNKHRDFDFSFKDHSIDISVNSTSARYIKTVIVNAIRAVPYFLVIVGAKTYKSNWVAWEINKAVEMNKRIVAVKTDRLNRSPDELMGVGASWAMSFTYLSISGAIFDAR